MVHGLQEGVFHSLLPVSSASLPSLAQKYGTLWPYELHGQWQYWLHLLAPGGSLKPESSWEQSEATWMTA